MLLNLDKIFDYITMKIIESNFFFPSFIFFLTIISPFALLIIFFITIFTPIFLLLNYCQNYPVMNQSIYKNKIKDYKIPIYDLDSYNKLTGTILIINPDNKLHFGILK